MVVRKDKRNRKYHGTRRWGVGNIKNNRGAGGHGGFGEVNRLRKHDWTYITAKAPELIKKRGFAPYRKRELKEINLRQISVMAEGKSEIELRNYKVLSNGELSKPIKIKASGFTRQALEKIKSKGGEAIAMKAAEDKAPAKESGHANA
jgi:ribosomal protein L15